MATSADSAGPATVSRTPVVESEKVEALPLIQPDDTGLVRVQFQPEGQHGLGFGLSGDTDDHIVGVPDQTDPAPQPSMARSRAVK
jgi:hypothetical protein